jgi:DNA-directed RNA polymerase sigma subunit (sigma70/sigma32)
VTFVRTREQILAYSRAYSRAYYWKHKTKIRAQFKLPDRSEALLFHRAAVRTYKEVSEIMGLSPEYIRQLERTAFHKLRKHPQLLAHWLEFKKHS